MLVLKTSSFIVASMLQFAAGLQQPSNEDLFHDMLTGLASDSANNFSFIDTRNTLTRDATHPSRQRGRGWRRAVLTSEGFVPHIVPRD
jgi:hypothetical protein